MQKNSAKNFMKPKYLEKSFTRTLTFERQQEYAALHATLKKKLKQDEIKNDFMAFVKEMWPEFIEGRHHTEISKKFNDIAKGKIKRLIINMPPRHTKSEFASFLLPSWMVGRKPDLKIIQTSNTTELALRFGRKAKTLIDSPEYQKIFQTRLREDSQAAGKWETEQGGEYYAAGVGSAITGRGADLLIIDDPHSEQDAMNPEALERAYDWYTSGPRQRLQPGGAIVIVMTRWHQRDLTGQIIDASIKRGGADEWKVIELPAIMPSGNPLWPEFWSQTELDALKAELPVSKWSAQYQQDPTSEEGALIKREWWRIWEHESPPNCEFIIQSWDTAFLKTERADYSACTTWGVFYAEDEFDGALAPQLILLDAYKERLEFPELKAKALEMYKAYQPDAFVVEGKAAGMPLIFELRSMGIPVTEYTPSRGNDKIARVNAVADLFASGVVWCPETRWAEEVVEEFAAFPNAEHDDLVDSSTQALSRFRQGGFISLFSDEIDEPYDERKRAEYY